MKHFVCEHVCSGTPCRMGTDGYTPRICMMTGKHVEWKEIEMKSLEAENHRLRVDLHNAREAAAKYKQKIGKSEVYTCNCKTPMYKAAPEMYGMLEKLLIEAHMSFNRITEVDEILKKARGEK